jgi:proline iminopeptidase
MKRKESIMTSRMALALMLALGACGDNRGPGTPLVDEGSFSTADDIDIFYRVYGKPLGSGASTIVVIHGGPGEHMQWYVRDLEFLVREHTVIYYDQRGGGRSELPEDTTALTIQHHVADLEAVRQHFGLERMTLVAHSFGPGLAALYAIAHPERVERMRFIGPIPPRLGTFFEEYGANLTNRLTPAALSRLNELDAQWASATDLVAVCKEYWSLGIPPRLADPSTSSRLEAEPCDAPVAALRYARAYTNPVTFESLGDWNWLADLADLDVPTLVIHGEQEAIPMAMVEEWVTTMPDARLLRVPNAAHFPYTEQPDLVVPAMEQFVLGQWPAGAVTLAGPTDRSVRPDR